MERLGRLEFACVDIPVGMVDTMMVSTIGGEAIAAVSFVDSINNLVIQIFSAMASGAIIICSQYIGSGNKKGSNKAAEQVVFASQKTVLL